MAYLAVGHNSAHLSTEEEEPRLRRNSTKWVADFARLMSGANDLSEENLPAPVAHQGGSRKDGSRSSQSEYSEQEFFDAETDEASVADGHPSSNSKFAQRLESLNKGRRRSATELEKEQEEQQKAQQKRPGANSTSSGAMSLQKELYAYRMPCTVPDSELERIQESEEASLKKCTFQPKINSASKSTPSGDGEVFTRLGCDATQRMKAKERVKDKATQEQLKACTFAPKISYQVSNAMSTSKKVSAQETTKRMWQDIEDRKHRHKQLVEDKLKQDQEDDGEQLTVRKKVLSRKEAKELAERMKADELKRDKQYQTNISARFFPEDLEDLQDPCKRNLLDVTLPKAELAQTVDRLYAEERRRQRQEQLRHKAETELPNDCTFRPNLSAGTQELIRRRQLGAQYMPTPILNNPSSDPIKRASAGGNASRGRSLAAGPDRRRAQSAPKRLTPATSKEASSSDQGSRLSKSDHKASTPVRQRPPEPSSSSRRRAASQPPPQRGGKPQSSPVKAMVWEKETFASAAHRQAQTQGPSWAKALRVSNEGSPRKSSSSKRRSRSQGDRLSKLSGANDVPAFTTEPIRDDHEAYHKYFANRPTVTSSSGRRNRWVSLEEPLNKPLVVSYDPMVHDLEAMSAQPQPAKRSVSLNARGGSPGSSTTARSFANPREPLIYTHLERRIEDELQRRLEARGVVDHPLKH